MDESVPNQSHTLPSYKCIRKDRSDVFKQKYGKTNGGGLAIYYKEHLKVDTMTKLSEECEEILWVKVKVKQEFLLALVYRAEYTEMLTQTENPTKFEESLKKATEQSKNIVLLGDLNCDIAADKPDNETEILVEICETYDLHQLITKPTRINPKSRKATTIDHIWTDYTTEVIKAGTIIGISDHFGVYSRLKLQKPSDDNTPKRVRNFKNYKPLSQIPNFKSTY